MKKSGFTLIELIVSTCIIAMMTGIFLANYSSTNRRTDLTMTAQKLVTDIRLAQNYSLGLARYGSSSSTNVPAGGWGLNIDLSVSNNTYTIFADDDGDKVYDPGEANLSYGAQVMTLPANVIIDSLQSVGTKVNVTFLPPDPITTITGSVTTAQQVDIVLKDTQTNQIKTVRINFLGLVEVIN